MYSRAAPVLPATYIGPSLRSGWQCL